MKVGFTENQIRFLVAKCNLEVPVVAWIYGGGYSIPFTV